MSKTTSVKKNTKSKSLEQKAIKETISKLLELLEIDGDFEFIPSIDGVLQNQEEINLVLNTKDSGIVIGYHGEVLEALQLVLSLCVSKKLDRFIRISIDVGEYKKNRSEFLENLAFQAKERVLQENREFPLPNLKSWERRIVHLILQNDEEVKTESMGEGKNRMLVVKPR